MSKAKACLDLLRADVRTLKQVLNRIKLTDSLSSFNFIIKLNLIFQSFYGGCGFRLQAKPLKNKKEKH